MLFPPDKSNSYILPFFSIQDVNIVHLLNRVEGGGVDMDLHGLNSFLRSLLSGVLSDVFILFVVIYLGEWLADVWGFSRVERAWWITLATLLMLTFILWSRLGRILLWN